MKIAVIFFSGRDMAAGKSWEAWLRHYWEKKAAGEQKLGCSRRLSSSFALQQSLLIV